MNDITWVEPGILGFGDIEACACAAQEKDWAVVHACKHPCHRAHVGYKNTLPKEHPHYLYAEKDGQLYLNLIDPPVPLFQLESFKIFFDFMDRYLHKKPVVIHCNRGESRAPSLSLLIMAKRLRTLPDDNYTSAREAFETRFAYKPGGGISIFLEKNWEVLGQ